MIKKYFVQTRYPDGEIGGGMRTKYQIIDMFGFRDCTDCEFEVYDVSEFGKVVKLEDMPANHTPCNYHCFCNTETGEVVFEGYSSEY